MFTLLVLSMALGLAGCTQPALDVDWAGFLSRHDLQWSFDYSPHSELIPVFWWEAGYIGNGMMGATVRVDNSTWPNPGTAKLIIAVNRVDAWVGSTPPSSDKSGYRRTPIGSLWLDTGLPWDGQGRIEMSVRLHDAELQGRVLLQEAPALSFRCLISAARLAESTLVLDMNSSGALPAPVVEWKPCAVQRGPRGPGQVCDQFAPTNCSCVETVKVSEENHSPSVFYQPTNGSRPGFGGVAVAVATLPQQGNRSTVWLSTSQSLFDPTPSNASILRASTELQDRLAAGLDELVTEHRAWWHAWWPASFLSIPDTRLEGFYYANVYRFAAISRHGVHDLEAGLGPEGVTWHWGDYMWDMNPEVTYFMTHASNRLDLIKTLIDAFDDIDQSSHKWIRYGGTTPSERYLLWMLRSYHKYTLYTGDVTRQRETLYRLLGLGLSQIPIYRLPDRPADDFRSSSLLDDGIHYHVVGVTSPEYGADWNSDCNFTALTHNCTNTNFGIAIVSWAVNLVLELITKFQIPDNKTALYRDISRRLYPLSYDETGYMVDWVHRFEKPHRHWSHLLALYDLEIVPITRELAEKSVDRWTGLTCNDSVPCPTHCRGFTRGIAGIMSAKLGRGAAAAGNLSKLIDPVVGVITPNGIYGEGVTAAGPYELSPCTESAYVGSAVLHEMFVQANAENVTVFPAAHWPDSVFYHLRALNGLLVSAVRKSGHTLFVSLEAVVAGMFRLSVPDWTSQQPSVIPTSVPHKHNADGSISIQLAQGDSVTVYTGSTVPDLRIQPIQSDPSGENYFGMKRTPTCMSLGCSPGPIWPTFQSQEQCNYDYYCDTHTC